MARRPKTCGRKLGRYGARLDTKKIDARLTEVLRRRGVYDTERQRKQRWKAANLPPPSQEANP